MALPEGVLTCTLTFGSSLTFDGSPVAMSVTCTPTHSLTWEATGQPIVDFPLVQSAQAGMPGQIIVPVTDQDGFLGRDGEPITGWAYSLHIIWTHGGQRREQTKHVQPVTGQNVIDVDLLPSGSITTPVVAPTPVVTSIAGLTGPLTAEEVVDALIETLVEKLADYDIGAGGGGGASGVFVVEYDTDAEDWPYADLEAAQEAGLLETELLVFVGVALPPAWAAEHTRGFVHFTG